MTEAASVYPWLVLLRFGCARMLLLPLVVGPGRATQPPFRRADFGSWHKTSTGDVRSHVSDWVTSEHCADIAYQSLLTRIGHDPCPSLSIKALSGTRAVEVRPRNIRGSWKRTSAFGRWQNPLDMERDQSDNRHRAKSHRLCDEVLNKTTNKKTPAGQLSCSDCTGS
jgi:hypothetical protein